jgi:AcrR family transcriptional regulator
MKPTSEFWIEQCGNPAPSVKEQLVILTAREVAKVGVTAFNAKDVCDLVGAKYPMINYYFGSRDGLLLAASLWVNDQWIRAVRGALSTKPTEAMKQLKAICKAEVAFGKEWGAMALLAANPSLVGSASEDLESEEGDTARDRREANTELYLGILTKLIHDARKGKKSLVEYRRNRVPIDDLKTHPLSYMAATNMAWSIRGLVAWFAGPHDGDWGIENPSGTPITEQYMAKQHIKRILKATQFDV